MKLPAIPFLTKKVNTEYFLSLIFELDKISAILFKEQEKTLVILSTCETPLDPISSSTEDMTVAADKVISKIEMNLPEGAILEKTIFSVPYSWVEEGRIIPLRLNELKKISTELALTPMGFIVSIEAIIAFLQKKEGAPISGVFVELSSRTLSVYIVRSGNVIDVKHGSIDGGVEKTVEKLLSSVTTLDVLPSKIVLLHTKEAEEVSQKFLSHHWTKELPFMHLPQVAILDKGFENEAIVSGVASQLNVSVVGDIKTSQVEEIVDEEEEFQESTDTFGFLQDEDIAQAKEAKEEKEENEFAFEEDEKEPVIHHHDEKIEEAGEEILEEDDQMPASSQKRQGKGIGAILSSLITPQSVGKIPKMIGSGRKLIIPFAALVVVALLLTAYYTVILKANVIIFTDQKAFSENALAVSLTTSGESSFEDKTLRIVTVNEQVEGEESQETTGQKDTGQKATGTVTIFNKSESPRELEKGTVLTSSNNLEFVLDDAVKVASTSSFSTSFSNVQAKVTASDFGKEFNLPSQTNFTIKGIATSVVFGRNDSAFSGGSKEEIQVVAKKDLTSLEQSITKRLFDKAKSQAESSLGENDALLPNFLSVDFREKDFDKKENDEAKSVKLTATLDYTLGMYKKDELTKFIASSDEFDVPDDFQLSEDSSITLSDIQQNKNDISAKISFNAIFQPQLDVSKVPQEISGKGREQAIERLKSISGITDATIQFKGSIPFLPSILPLNASNITIEQKTE